MRKPWKVTAIALGVLLGAAVLGDALLSPGRSRATDGPPPPPEARRPESTAALPTEEQRKAYLARKPLDVGMAMPDLQVVNHRSEALQLPRRGRSGVWAILCGCSDCLMVGLALKDFKQRSKGPVEMVIFVANRSDFIWRQMQETFGPVAEMVHDPRASYYQQLRPRDSEFPYRPAVWGLNEHRRIVYHERPGGYDRNWTALLTSRIGVKVRPGSAGVPGTNGPIP